MNQYYVPFTKEMKDQGYTLLIPNMLPMHFRLIARVLEGVGYHPVLLQNEGPQIAELGLKYTHNDTCYPALLVIGQFLDAIQNGGFDPHKTALIMFQTGGGCRASNYISLIRKALAKAGYDYIPVISFSLAGIEKHPGWKLSPLTLMKMMYVLLYGDLLMDLFNQCRSYELEKGTAQALCQKWTDFLVDEMKNPTTLRHKHIMGNYKKIIEDFKAIPMDRSKKKPCVGIVGEIFVKFSSLANNNLEQYLVDEGAEVVVPGLLDFMLYSFEDGIMDYKLYNKGKKSYPIVKFAFNYFAKRKRELIDLMKEDGFFRPASPIEHTISLTDGYIGLGAKMGEGWLLTAEMLELGESGVKNIVCAQPFGCLPNHICGKGMMKPIKEKHPEINITAIDYDPGASRVNQLNRIKLMLSNAEY